MISGKAVSVVIPTIGRASLRRAVESVLHQTSPPIEVIVVVDADCEPDLPDSDSIRVLRTSGGVGPSCARHIGVSSAKGEVIALLDDDDVWRPHKLERQLAAAPPGHEWIVSCRYVRHVDGRKPRTHPGTLLRRDERLAPYFFQFHSPPPRHPRWLLPSTLLFPRAVAQRVPWSSVGWIHDDPKWAIEVQRALPNVRIVQVPEPLVDVMYTPGSVSFPGAYRQYSGLDQTKEYIDWGIRELADESRRVRGDFMLCDPVHSALLTGSFRGVARSVVAGVRFGRPGVWAWAYVVAAIMKITWRRARSIAARAAERLR
jgi:glycosyltransferase involved in cell wall biosynthesis